VPGQQCCLEGGWWRRTATLLACCVRTVVARVRSILQLSSMGARILRPFCALPSLVCACTSRSRVLWLQNKDGLVDIVAVNSASNSITWYANRGGSMPSWTSNTLGGASSLAAPMGVTVADSTCCVESVHVQVEVQGGGAASSDTVVKGTPLCACACERVYVRVAMAVCALLD
jgi:hypothetical protein